MQRVLVSFVVVIAAVSGVAGCPSSDRPCRESDQCEDDEFCQFDGDDDVGVCVKGGAAEGEGEEGEGEGEGEEGEGEGEAPVATTARNVEIGGVFACAIDATAHVQCWGGNSRGQLGRVTARDRDDNAAPIPGLTDVVDLAVGEFHACALGRLDGGQQRLWCWGESSQGTLGTDAGVVEPGTLVEPELPAGFGTDAIDVGADGDNNGGFTCATDGTRVFCFGVHAPDAVNGSPVVLNGLGAASGGVDRLDVSLDGVCATSPTQDVTCVEVKAGLQLLGCCEAAECDAITNGAVYDSEVENACVIADGTASCAGENDFGVVDPGARANVDLPLTALISALDVAVGTQHACAVSGIAVKCWGRPLFGATGFLESNTLETEPCGDNPAVRCHGVRDVPMPGGIVGFVAVQTHRTHSCAVSSDGRVVCWGNPLANDDENTLLPRQIELFR